MSETKAFSTGALISVTTGRLACDMGEVYEILNHVLSDNLMTHQLPAASRAVEGWLVEQFPWIKGLELPEGGGSDFTEEIARLGDVYGMTQQIPVWADAPWATGNALQDAVDQFGSRLTVVEV